MTTLVFSKKIFPERNMYEVFDLEPDFRLDSWIWLYNRRESGQAACDFSLQLRITLATRLGATEFLGLIDFESIKYLLPQESLKWITKDVRQIKWILDYIKTTLKCDIPDCPPLLEGRNRVIASLDFWSCSLEQKGAAVRRMELDWYERLKEDDIFDWFKNRDASCFDFTWKWLVKNGRTKDFGGSPIYNYKDLVMFYDEIGATSLRKQVDAKAIKAGWATKASAKKKKENGERQCNVWISDVASKRLDELCVKLKLRKPRVIELLINKEFEVTDYLSKKY